MYTVIILVFLTLSRLWFEADASAKNDYCGELEFDVCVRKEENGSCLSNRTTKTELSWKAPQSFNNVTSVKQVSSGKGCYLTLCDDDYRMGYCMHFLPGTEEVTGQRKNILQTDFLRADCKCGNITAIKSSSDDFDRNYVGVVYSPYDKYWEPTGPNGTLRRFSWRDYTLDEMSLALRQISGKFTYISTYGMGTASNISNWHEGDKIAFVAYLSAKINRESGYLALRVSVGIFRKDDVNLTWKSKELYNAIDAARVANTIFNGTVWGIIVTSNYVVDSITASDALKMISKVKQISQMENLRLKVGIRLKTCMKYITRRPEDETVPTYTMDNPHYSDGSDSKFVPLSAFQFGLHEIAKHSDFILCDLIPSSDLGNLKMPLVIKAMQNEFLDLRDALSEINPKVKLVIETGVPNEGIGNGFQNTIENFRDYWKSMTDFSKREHLMFHMFEAIDQPWKNIQDLSNKLRTDANGPNGTDAHYGWWRRFNNSFPPVYIEKVKEIVQSNGPSNSESKSMSIELILILSFTGIGVVVIASMSSVFYMRRKLHKIKYQIISQAYIDQFLSGENDNSSNIDENYAVALKIPYDRKYELPKGTFQVNKDDVMGSGQSGIVCRGTIQCYTEPVAFKCTTPQSSVVDVKAIMSEIKILSYLGKHENLVCILGAYTKKIQRGIVYVALEYCELGNLESFLRRAELSPCKASKPTEMPKKTERYVSLGPLNVSSTVTNPGYVQTECLNHFQQESVPVENYNNLRTAQRKTMVDFPTLLIWSEQIASAMEYIATKKVVHADLAARNCLLASLNHVKVSDFGLSRKMYQELGVTHDKDTPLPWRWMAPESLRHLTFSQQSDVWAFAVTVWEIFSFAEVPYQGISYNLHFVDMLEEGMRLPMAKYATDEIHEELEKCWSFDPVDRPSFKELKQRFYHLRGVLDNFENESWF